MLPDLHRPTATADNEKNLYCPKILIRQMKQDLGDFFHLVSMYLIPGSKEGQ